MDARLIRQIAAGIASNKDLNAAGAEAVIEAKANGGPCVRMTAEDSQALDGRRIRYTWSTERVDRMGDIVRQNWDLGGFARNPVALWGHDHDTVIGRALDFGVEFGAQKQLAGTIEFAPEGSDPFIDSRFKLAAAGYLKATSVGFLPHTTDPVRDADKRKELGLGDYGVVFERNELLEISVVGVPANPDAVESDLSEFVQRGVLTADEAEVYARGSAQLTERDWFSRLERMAPNAKQLPDRRGLPLSDGSGFIPLQSPASVEAPDLAAITTELAALRDTIRELADHIKNTDPNGDAPSEPVAPVGEVSGRRGWDYSTLFADLSEQLR